MIFDWIVLKLSRNPCLVSRASLRLKHSLFSDLFASLHLVLIDGSTLWTIWTKWTQPSFLKAVEKYRATCFNWLSSFNSDSRLNIGIWQQKNRDSSCGHTVSGYISKGMLLWITEFEMLKSSSPVSPAFWKNFKPMYVVSTNDVEKVQMFSSHTLVRSLV